MWILKSTEELRMESRLRQGLAIGLVLLLWAGFFCLGRFYLSSSGQVLLDYHEELMILAGLASVWLVWSTARRRRQPRQNTVICDRCNLVQHAEGGSICKCGGTYFTLEEMKWVSGPPGYTSDV